MARQILCFLLAITLIPSKFAYADVNFDSEVTKTIDSKYGASILKLARNANRYAKQGKELTKKGFKTDAGQVVSGQLETITMISILSAIAIARENIRLAQIKKESIDVKVIAAASAKAAQQLVGSTEFWNSVAGAAVVNKFSAPVVKAFFSTLQTTAAKKALQEIIQIGAHTQATFLGWDFGGELIEIAALLIDNEEDRQRALQIGPLLISILSHTATADVKYLDDLRVLQLLLNNLVRIVFVDDQLRTIWMSQTWRNRIVTGKFATLVSSMWAASALSNYLGLRWLPRFGVSIVAGAAWSFIPEDAQDGLTRSFGAARKWFWMEGDDKGPLFNGKRIQMKLLYECVSQNITCPPMLRFSGNLYATEQTINILFDEFFNIEAEITVTQASIDLANQSQNPQAAQEYSNKLNDLIAMYKVRIASLESLYATELKQMDDLLREFPFQESSQKKYPQVVDILTYRQKVYALNTFMSAFARTVSNEMLSDDKSYLGAMGKIHFFGFTNDLFLESLDSMYSGVQGQ